MNWDSLKEAIEDVFDETLNGIDPDEKFQRLIIKTLKKRLTEEMEIELSLLDDEYDVQISRYKGALDYSLESLSSERSSDA